MYCYVIEAHGREIAYKKLPGSSAYITAIEDHTDTGPYSQHGVKFRQAFQARVALANPDWAGVDKVTVDHLAESDQEEKFDRAFSERAQRSEPIEDFMYWVVPAEPHVRPHSKRSATRQPIPIVGRISNSELQREIDETLVVLAREGQPK